MLSPSLDSKSCDNIVLGLAFLAALVVPSPLSLLTPCSFPDLVCYTLLDICYLVEQLANYNDPTIG